MTQVICSFLDPSGDPLDGYLEVSRPAPVFVSTGIGVLSPDRYDLVNGSVTVDLEPGRYVFRAYDIWAGKVYDRSANVPESVAPVELKNITRLTPYYTGGESTPATGVKSFNGRTGDIIPQSGDYTVSQIEGLPDALASLTTPAEVNDIISPLLEDKADVSAIALALSGKENSGTASGLMSSHLAALDPHPQYALSTDTLPWGQVSGKPDLLIAGSNITVGNITCNDVTGNMLSSNGYSLGLDFTILPQGGGLSNLQSWGGIWLGGLAGDTLSGAKSEAGVGQYRACVFIKPSSPTIPLYGGSAVNATSLLVKQATWQNGLSQEWHDSAGVSRAQMTHTGHLTLGRLVSTDTTQSTNTATGAIVTQGGLAVGGNANVGGYVASPILNLSQYLTIGTQARWRHTATANPTTRPDGTALQVGDIISCPVSQGLRGGEWELDSFGRWMSTESTMGFYALISNSAFSNQANVFFPTSSQSFSPPVDWLVERVYISALVNTAQSGSNYLNLRLQAEYAIDPDNGTIITLLETNTQPWTTPGAYREITVSPNIRLNRTDARYRRLFPQLTVQSFGTPGIFTQPNYEITLRRIRL